jgi:hypothetical protein
MNRCPLSQIVEPRPVDGRACSQLCHDADEARAFPRRANPYRDEPEGMDE